MFRYFFLIFLILETLPENNEKNLQHTKEKRTKNAAENSQPAFNFEN